MVESFKIFILSLLIVFIAGPSLALAQEAGKASTIELENKAYWLCKNRKEVRTIRVQNDAGLCSIFYSKLGDEKLMGSGKNEGSCINILNNIKTNLEKSNWNCRDISATRITASQE